MTSANSTTSVTVNNGTGSVYLNGLVSSTASKGKYNLMVTLQGPTNVSATNTGTWTV